MLFFDGWRFCLARIPRNLSRCRGITKPLSGSILCDLRAMGSANLPRRPFSAASRQRVVAGRQPILVAGYPLRITPRFALRHIPVLLKFQPSPGFRPEIPLPLRDALGSSSANWVAKRQW